MDAFQERFFNATQWLTSHTRTVILLLLPLAAVAIIAAGWRYYEIKQGEKRRDELARIDEKFDQEEQAANTKRQELFQKIENLEKKSAQKTDGKTNPHDAGTPEVDAKRKEVLAIKADHSATLTNYQKFYTANTTSPEGWRAALLAARILLEQKKLDDAAKLLGTVLKSAAELDFYQIQVRTLYISVLEDLKQYDLAYTELEKILSITENDAKAPYLLSKGKLLFLEGNKEEARKAFEYILSKYSATAEARKARALLALSL